MQPGLSSTEHQRCCLLMLHTCVRSTPHVQMTACAEKDNSAMESRPPKPAIEKLKALNTVGQTLRQRKFHETFIASKGLNAMAA